MSVEAAAKAGNKPSDTHIGVPRFEVIGAALLLSSQTQNEVTESNANGTTYHGSPLEKRV